MTGKIAKVKLGDRLVDGVEVSVDESSERFSEAKLSDGTKVRVKLSVISAYRIDGEYDKDGNPMYSFNMAPIISIVDCPPHLKKKVQ